jgi:hypothetical protein
VDGHGAKLPRKQEAAIAALLSSPTVKKAAERAGVGERSLRRWMAEDQGFKDAYSEARRRFLQLSLGRLSRATAPAVSRLIRLLRSEDRVALAAATVIVNQATKGEMLDVLARLDVLEAAEKRRAKK